MTEMVNKESTYDNPKVIIKLLGDFGVILTEEDKERIKKMTPNEMHRYKRARIDEVLDQIPVERKTN